MANWIFALGCLVCLGDVGIHTVNGCGEDALDDCFL